MHSINLDRFQLIAPNFNANYLLFDQERWEEGGAQYCMDSVGGLRAQARAV
jgi:hypothetical protein